MKKFKIITREKWLSEEVNEYIVEARTVDEAKYFVIDKPFKYYEQNVENVGSELESIDIETVEEIDE